MSLLPIYTYNDPALRKVAEPVEEDSRELQEFITDLFQTMYQASGVGLAAPQVGRSMRLFVVDTSGITEDDEEESDSGPLTFINPEIIRKSEKTVRMEEGCLSIPDVRDQVSRPEQITVRYLDRHFEEQELTAGDWLARVVQHELDHLNGVLFLDHLSAFRRRLHRAALKEIEEGLAETEYPVVTKFQKES
ncbi:MAG: peptide deformylase [Balneolaceae bacterium]